MSSVCMWMEPSRPFTKSRAMVVLPLPGMPQKTTSLPEDNQTVWNPPDYKYASLFLALGLVR